MGTGGVYQDAEAAEVFDGLLHDARDARLVREVGGERLCGDAAAFQFADEVRGDVGIGSVGDGHVVAEGRELSCDGGADAAGAARDQCGAATSGGAGGGCRHEELQACEERASPN